MNQWQIYQSARSLTLLGTILRNKNNVEEKTKWDTGAAQNCWMLPRQERCQIQTLPRIARCYLSRNMFCREANIQRNDQPNGVIREYTLRIDTFHDSMVDTWKSTIWQKSSAYQSLPGRRECAQRGNDVITAEWKRSKWTNKRRPWHRNTIGVMHRCATDDEEKKKQIWRQRTIYICRERDMEIIMCIYTHIYISVYVSIC